MVIQEKVMTAEEFAALPDDGKLHDLVKGVVVEVSRPKPLHGEFALRIGSPIYTFVREHGLGLVTSESGYILARNPDTVRGPDIAFLSKRRVADPDLSQYIPTGPDLAVEIVSPGDAASEILEKVEEYFKAGTQLVWVFYPDRGKVYVYTSPDVVKILKIDDTLDGGDVLPGFKLVLREVFKGLTQE